jgi:hypothetical protein
LRQSAKRNHPLLENATPSAARGTTAARDAKEVCDTLIGASGEIAMADTNNVFISWSGPRSNHVAKFLRKWLRSVIHSARPWMSEKDIKSGSVSVNSIRTALASVKAGIVCLTPESLKEPWLNFEAGGLLRTPEAETRVCTYLLAGLEPGQLEYPLAMFQARIADREQTLALVQDINR